MIRNSAICAALDAEEIKLLNRIGRRRTLAPGETLVWEGDDSVIVANVIEGVLKLSNGTSDGHEQIVGVAFPADYIGGSRGEVSRQSVTALTDARVCLFSRNDFEAFAATHPALEHKLLQRTLAELDRTREWMVLLGRKNAEEKVASFLLEMSDRLVDPNCTGPASGPLDTFELPFSRQQIGDILGLTIETVSRQLTALKRNKIIALPSRRQVEIRDRAALRALAG